jgi:hypothetical protein
MKPGTLLMLAVIMLISMSNIEVTAFDQGQCEQQCMNTSKHCVESAPISRKQGDGTDPSVKWTKYCFDVLGTCLQTCEPVSTQRRGTGGPSVGRRTFRGTGAGGAGTGGTAVKTGKGPLSEPIAPATSTTNPQQNSQGNLLRPQNMPGPALTNPPQNPFGSK